MMSNITNISNASPPRVDPEPRAKANHLEEDATRQAQQAQSVNNPATQPRISPAASNLLTVKAPHPPGSIAQDISAQDTKAQDAKLLARIVDELNQHLKGLSRTSLQFNVDDVSDKMVVKVIDVEKDELIRQIPPEELLKLAAFIKEKFEKETEKMEALVPNKSAAKAFILEGLLVRTHV